MPDEIPPSSFRVIHTWKGIELDPEYSPENRNPIPIGFSGYDFNPPAIIETPFFEDEPNSWAIIFDEGVKEVKTHHHGVLVIDRDPEGGPTTTYFVLADETRSWTL